MNYTIALSIILFIIVGLYFFYHKRENYSNSYQDIIDNLNANKTTTQKEEKPQLSASEQEAQREQTNKTIDQQFKDLDELESKCSNYFKTINKNYDEQKKAEIETMYNELDIQDKKIKELEKIVNIYRNQYLVRKGITNKCREKTQKTIENDIENISKLVDNNKLVNQNVKLNVSFADKEKEVEESGNNTLRDTNKDTCNSNKLVDISNKQFAKKLNSLTNSELGTQLRDEAVNLSLNKYI